MEYFLNLFYVYMIGCAFLSLCFGAEWAIIKWEKRARKDDNPFS